MGLAAPWVRGRVGGTERGAGRAAGTKGSVPSNHTRGAGTLAFEVGDLAELDLGS